MPNMTRGPVSLPSARHALHMRHTQPPYSMSRSRRAGERSGNEESLLQTSAVDFQVCYSARLKVNLAPKRRLVLWASDDEGTDVLRGRNLDARIGLVRSHDGRHVEAGHAIGMKTHPDTNDLIVP